MRTFLPEWAPQDAILMAFPTKHTDWEYIIDDARDQYARIIRAFTDEKVKVVLLCHDRSEAEKALENCDLNLVTFIECEYNDTWTRDYGPISIIKNDRLRALDFGFNGWGLKFASDKDNLANLNLSNTSVLLPRTYRNERDFVLEGDLSKRTEKGRYSQRRDACARPTETEVFQKKR